MHMNEHSEHLAVSDIDTAFAMFTNSICSTADKQAQKHIGTSAQQEVNAFILTITSIFMGSSRSCWQVRLGLNRKRRLESKITMPCAKILTHNKPQESRSKRLRLKRQGCMGGQM